MTRQNLSDVPGIEDAFDYIRVEAVREALGHLILQANAHGRPVRKSSHGYMTRVYTFAARGTRHPAVSVCREHRTLYTAPDNKKVKIRSIEDVPHDLF